MKRIVFDLDDTLLVEAMKGIAEEFLKKEINLDEISDGRYINQFINDPLFDKYLIDKNLYDFGFIKEGTIDLLHKLSEDYDVYIASTYFFPGLEESSSVFLKRKFEFLRKNFGFLGYSKFLFVGDKKIFDFDYAVGDSLSDMIGRQNFLVTSYHNKQYNDDVLKQCNSVRIDDICELEKFL
ncbi:MAG: hypothetical protein PHD02_01270 [Bacilli bacterium]|nr:hypothetical protein [Bacilli bacterium]